MTNAEQILNLQASVSAYNQTIHDYQAVVEDLKNKIKELQTPTIKNGDVFRKPSGCICVLMQTEDSDYQWMNNYLTGPGVRWQTREVEQEIAVGAWTRIGNVFEKFATNSTSKD